MISRQQYEFLRSMGGLFDQAVVPPSVAPFVDSLDGDDDLQAIYFDLVELDVELEWLYGTRPALTLSQAASTPKENGVKNSQSEQQAAVSKAVVVPSVAPRRGRSIFSFAVFGYVALVAICLYGSFALIAWNMRPTNLANSDGRSTERVAVVLDSAEAKWATPAAKKPADSPITQGELLNIESGFVKLELKRGVTLLVEGPARWSIDGDNRATVKFGRYIATVPPQAIGFMIETPQANIVDLGTEFGVATNVSGETEVNVFRGRVLVKPTAKTSTASPEPFFLEAGEARRISEGVTVTVTNSQKSGTWKRLTERLVPREQVYPDSLIGYWSFDKYGIHAGREERNGLHGTLGASTQAEGITGRGAVRFNNSGQRVRVPLTNANSEFDQELTIEAAVISAWSGKQGDDDYLFRKQDGGYTTIKLALTNEAGTGPSFAFEVSTARGVQVLHMPLDGNEGRPTFSGFVNGKPHHVVATFNGSLGEMTLFVDGVMCRKQTIEKGVQVGRDASNREPEARKITDSFNGVIDEVALYQAAISPEVVSAHWQNLSEGRSFFAQPVSDKQSRGPGN